MPPLRSRAKAEQRNKRDERRHGRPGLGRLRKARRRKLASRQGGARKKPSDAVAVKTRVHDTGILPQSPRRIVTELLRHRGIRGEGDFDRLLAVVDLEDHRAGDGFAPTSHRNAQRPVLQGFRGVRPHRFPQIRMHSFPRIHHWSRQIRADTCCSTQVRASAFRRARSASRCPPCHAYMRRRSKRRDCTRIVPQNSWSLSRRRVGRSIRHADRVAHDRTRRRITKFKLSLNPTKEFSNGLKPRSDACRRELGPRRTSPRASRDVAGKDATHAASDAQEQGQAACRAPNSRTSCRLQQDTEVKPYEP